jgi:O-succinylbenzoic acid--CoA ligase
MFISGGENIHPEEIEAALLQIAGITEALVVPITDPEFGSRPVAFIRCDGSLPFNEQSIRKHLEATSLPRFKLPVRFFDWPKEIPSDQIKPNRKQFKEITEDWVKRKP